MHILDFHTHAFPDALAGRAIEKLEENADDMRAETDGTVGGLQRLMDANGVRAAVIASIATKPEQAGPIVEWSQAVRSERIIPFASVHPRSPNLRAEVEAIVQAGIRGVKLHPMYQNFAVDDPAVFPAYDAIRDSGLAVLFHAGYDIAFGKLDVASPARFARVRDRFEGTPVVLAHLGGWCDWDEVVKRLAGSDYYFDTSFAVELCPDALRDAILERHGVERIVFGSDSPWGGLGRQIVYVNAFPLSDAEKECVFWRNGATLLGI